MLSDKIKKYRLDNNLTQQELADRLFVSRNAVSKWETNNGYPSIEILKELSKLLNVSIDDLLEQDDVKSITINNNYKLNKYKNYLFNILVFLSYSLIAILIPHLMFKSDPTSVMAYCLINGPISFVILGILTPLYNKQVLNTFIASALAITPILIYFEVATKVVIYHWEIVYYLLFIVSYCIMLCILKINLKNNIYKILKWISLSVLIFLSITYIVLCIISMIKYNDSYSAPKYMEPLVLTLIFIIPIVVSSVLFVVFKKKSI